MNFTTRLLMPLAAISLIAAPALAQSFRIPTSGTPAVEIAKQTGWTERYDEHGNLTLFADDMAGAILLRMITAAPGEPMPSNAEMAQVILTGAGAKPYHKSEKTTFAGGPAEAFYSDLTIEGGPVVNIKVVVRKHGERSIAVGVTMIPEASTPAQRQKVDTQFAVVRIVG
ncbi:MAG: hypothetical protein KA233_04195 [Novosphingobium sp.]|jgi:uncharacterized protein with FMN-binding domain|nr:hypothetical protein [Novosphingobium sp.]MBP6554862.1 hypothetical protein [Novosphingobium sp.]